MRHGMKILDADAHVVEPGWLFERWLPAGREVWDLPNTAPMIPCGDAGLLADQMENGFDAPSYLRAMDAQGIDAVVLYPSVGLFVPYLPELDAAASADACRAYNEWMADYCAAQPGRLAGVGLVPLADSELAAREAQHCAELGLVGVLARPNCLYRRQLGDAAYQPLYEALADSGLVLSVHEGLGLRGPTLGSERFASFAERHMCSHPMEQMAAMAGLMLGGTLERHPTLRVAFLESGSGWLPYWLSRLDEHAEWLADSECAELSLAPSDYFARQCAISTDPEDTLADWVSERIGAQRLLWASDFPHPDALFPNAVDAFVDKWQARGGDSEQLAALMWHAPLAFYRLEQRFG